jgi:hypothetical protein
MGGAPPPEGNYPGCTNPDEVGEALYRTGTVDRSTAEFALSPSGYGQYQSRFPNDVDFTAGVDDPKTDWSYIQPGPQEPWAGSKTHTFTYRFDLEEVPEEGLRFIAWLVDTPRAFPSSIDFSLNGTHSDGTAVAHGGGDGYHWGDGRGALNRGIKPTSIEFPLPASELRAGENVIEITRSEGSWLVYDAFGVFEKRDVPDCEKRVYRGHIDQDRVSEYVYVPVDVPAGTTELTVRHDYTGRGPNVLDLGAFDPDGNELGTQDGFRGWSGGARSDFTISRAGATPGYIPGAPEPGTWNVGLGVYRLAPGGTDWKLEVTLRSDDTGAPFEATPAPRKVNDEPGWYRGDLHLHTVHSDGFYLPGEIVSYAKRRNLDFVVSTEHNTSSASLVWGRYADPDVLIMDGEEVTTRNGHWGAIGLSPAHWIDMRHYPGDGLLSRFVEEVHADGGLAVANHPFAGCGGCEWQFPYEGMDGIEVWNGPWDGADEQALKLWDGRIRNGNFMPAVGASDTHRVPDVVGLPQTVVRAASLSKPGVVEGLKAGRSYIAANPDTYLDMTATTEDGLRSGIGERISSGPGTPVGVSLRVQGAPGTTVTFHNQDGVLKTTPIPDGDETVTLETSAGRTDYVRAEVRRPGGGMVAFTNPIFVGREGSPEIPDTRPPSQVTGLDATGGPGSVALSWEAATDNYLVGGYEVYGSREPGFEVGPETLLGRTDATEFTHSNLDKAAQTWYYRVRAVDADGNVGKASEQASATTDEVLSSVGNFDKKSLEFALAPNRYNEYTQRFPDDVDFTAGQDDPSSDWSYIHPGPLDSWAGGRQHPFVFRFNLAEAPAEDLKLVVWLLDTHHSVPGTARISLNGAEVQDVELPAGGGSGYSQGDASEGAGVEPTTFSVTLPASRLREGENAITVSKPDGSWMVYDALGVVRRG